MDHSLARAEVELARCRAEFQRAANNMLEEMKGGNVASVVALEQLKAAARATLIVLERIEESLKNDG